MSDCAIFPALGLQSARLTISERVLRLPIGPCAHARRAFQQSTHPWVQEGPAEQSRPDSGLRLLT